MRSCPALPSGCDPVPIPVSTRFYAFRTLRAFRGLHAIRSRLTMRHKLGYSSLTSESPMVRIFRWTDIQLLYVRELRSALRERNIVINGILVPIFLYPLMLWLIYTGITFVSGQTEGFASRMVLKGVPQEHQAVTGGVQARHPDRVEDLARPDHRYPQWNHRSAGGVFAPRTRRARSRRQFQDAAYLRPIQGPQLDRPRPFRGTDRALPGSLY